MLRLSVRKRYCNVYCSSTRPADAVAYMFSYAKCVGVHRDYVPLTNSAYLNTSPCTGYDMSAYDIKPSSVECNDVLESENLLLYEISFMHVVQEKTDYIQWYNIMIQSVSPILHKAPK
jgi:hypothetical protein